MCLCGKKNLAYVMRKYIFSLICFVFFSVNHLACISCEEKDKATERPNSTSKKGKIASFVSMDFSLKESFFSNSTSTSSSEGKTNSNNPLKKKKRLSSSRDLSLVGPNCVPKEKKVSFASSDDQSPDLQDSDKSKKTYSDSNSVSHSLAIDIEELTEEDLLANIIKELEYKYPEPTIIFLKQLAYQDSLQSSENKELTFAEFIGLKESIEPSGSVLINQPGLGGEQNNVNWQELDIGSVVEKLSLIDFCLFQRVSYDDINRHVKDQKDCSESIANLGNQFTRIANLVAFQIVATKTEQERKKLTKRFFLIGRLLFEKHNFHGTMQIVTAFKTAAVERLLSIEEKSELNWTTFSKIGEYTNNFQVYRDLLLKFQDGPTCLPIFSLVLSDMFHDYELFESAAQIKNKEAMAGRLEGIAKALMTFSKCQALPNPILGDANDPLLKLFREFKGVDSEVLDVFSSLHKEWNLSCDTEKPMELKDWTPWYFASLLKKSGCKSQIRAIFDKGIYNGMDIITYMGDHNQQVKLTELGINEKMIKTIISAHL